MTKGIEGSWLDSQGELARRQAETDLQPQPSRACFLKPTEGRVVCLRDEVAQRGRIILPKAQLPRPTTGIVIACGPGTEEWLGKRVLWSMMSGVPLHFRGCEGWQVLQMEEIMAEVDSNDAQLDYNVE